MPRSAAHGPPPRQALDDERAAAAALGPWFDRCGRDLPWRRTRDPYRIWVSEVMLQQTQVATVLGYYERFIAAFPTIAALAAAPIAEVLRLWEGLGYYTRARNLHRAAGIVARDHGAALPDRFDAVAALPGIGRSTAGAILCFAHEQVHPILDGNVKRVLARLFAIDGDIARAAVQRQLWAEATAFLAATSDTWRHNQALMELGATVCATRSPSCGACPLSRWCRARAAGLASELPRRKPRKAVPHREVAIGLVRDARGRLLVQLRPAEGLLGGLWEFPGGKIEAGETGAAALRRELAEECGIEVEVVAPVIDVDHAYSHFTVTLHVYECRLVSGEPRPLAAQECRWIELAALGELAFPRANRKIIEALLAPPPPLFAADAERDYTPERP